MILDDILHGSKYNMERFTEDNKKALLARTTTKTVRGKETLYVTCPVRNKEIKLTPEESVMIEIKTPYLIQFKVA